MKRADLNQIVRFDGRLMEVFAIGEGRTIHMRPVSGEKCEHCGYPYTATVLEHSPLFQHNVEPVETVGER